MVDNLLHEHVELPHVLDLAVRLVQLMTWIIDHVIIVSPQSQLDLDFDFGLVLVWFWD